LIPMYGDRVGLLKTMCQNVTWGPCGEPLDGVSWACRSCYLQDPNLGWHPLADPNMGEQTADERQNIASELDFFRSNYLQHFQLLKGPPVYLSKLVALARTHHVQVALVVTPLHALYRALLSPVQWQAIMAYWRTFADENHVAFDDESEAAGYSDADFRDPHHLAVSGAEKFAKWMALNMIAPELGLQTHSPIARAPSVR
jgi:hypothetical protein